MTDDHAIQPHSDAKYFTLIPRLVLAIARTPYDLALWVVIRDIAGADGECYLSRENLAILAMMSPPKVTECRDSLLAAGLLEGEFRQDPGYPQPVWHLRIPDLWKENLEWATTYATVRDRIQAKQDITRVSVKGGHHVAGGQDVSRGGQDVSIGGHHVATKNNHKEEPERKPKPADTSAVQASSVDLFMSEHYSKASLRDAHTERCTMCLADVSQEQDECPSCQTPVKWHGSKIADARYKRRKATDIDNLASQKRRDAKRLSPLMGEVLLRAQETAPVPGEIHFIKDEEKRLHAYEKALGPDPVRDRLQHMLDKKDQPQGRGLIVALLASLAYVGKPDLANVLAGEPPAEEWVGIGNGMIAPHDVATGRIDFSRAKPRVSA